MKPFLEKINRQVFKNEIINILDYEGSNWTINSVVRTKLKENNNQNFYDRFIKICKEFNVRIFSTYTDRKYQIVINVNGNNSLTMEVENESDNISKVIAHYLFDELGTQILNREFINKHKEIMEKNNSSS